MMKKMMNTNMNTAKVGHLDNASVDQFCDLCFSSNAAVRENAAYEQYRQLLQTYQ